MDYDKENIATSQHDERADATHESGRDEKFSQALLGEPGVWQATLEEARAANVHEHSLSIRQAVRKYPSAVLSTLSSLVLSMPTLPTQNNLGSLIRRVYTKYRRNGRVLWVAGLKPVQSLEL
jgi:hypothetical protein